jgi:D-aminopeptidase
MRPLLLVPCLLAGVSSALAIEPDVPRARDLGIPFAFGVPGRWNAITDVPGVEVGHATLVLGEAVRTGVTGGPSARKG